MSKTITWDGKNLAAIQAIIPTTSRDENVITYRVDADWNLEVGSIRVLPGQVITVSNDGTQVQVSEPGYDAVLLLTSDEVRQLERELDS